MLVQPVIKREENYRGQPTACSVCSKFFGRPSNLSGKHSLPESHMKTPGGARRWLKVGISHPRSVCVQSLASIGATVLAIRVGPKV